MLRLPPTSISLSTQDVELHLHQAEICHGLLKQGFKKSDVFRYLDDFRQAVASQNKPQPPFDLKTPSTVDLQLQRSESVDADSRAARSNRQASSQSSKSDASSRSSSYITPPEPSDEETAGFTPCSDESLLSPELPPVPKLVNQHAPRKSSLLRFAEPASPNISSPESDNRTVISATAFVSASTKKYRKRSNTYPYQSSERESTSEASTQEQLRQHFTRLSLEQSTEDDDSREMVRLVYGRHRGDTDNPSPPFASPIGSPSHVDNFMGYYDGNLEQWSSRPRDSSSQNGDQQTLADISSSPPFPMTPSRHSVRHLPTSSTSNDIPTTPSPIRNAMPPPPLTDPRHYRQQLDGDSFSVYNDALPADSQPQTPAELSRQTLITEREAAYTAPPGMIHTPGRRQARIGWDREPGEPSPTTWALSIRDRRQRELARGVRAEGVRLNRLRMRDEAMFTQQPAETDGRPAREPLTQLQEDPWRDDLDADRVGEENFEDLAGVGHPRVMRAMSGNARFDIWEVGGR
jgi:hypothetical protein